MNHRIRLLIVARDAPHRQAMRAWLADAAGVIVVGEALDGSEALTLTDERQPDVVLLGVGPPGLDDLQTVARLHARYPHSKVVVLSRDGDQGHLALEVLREGAWGYLAGEWSRPSKVVEAIRTVARGGAILSPSVAGRILDELSQSRW